MRNKLLLKQINKYFGDALLIPENLFPLLNAISESYDNHEKSRKILEHSIEMSSMEMNEINDKLRQETTANSKVVYETLKESLGILNDKSFSFQGSEQEKLIQIAALLKEETPKRKLAERELEESKAFLVASQRVAHTGSWELNLSIQDDPYANTLKWSDETYNIFGFTPGSVEVSSNLFFDMVHPDDRRSIKDAVSRALETGEVYDIEHRIVLLNGQEKIVHERSEIIYDPKTSRPVKMIGTVQDITDKITSERKLQKAHDELKTLFDNMREVFFSVDMQTYELLQMSGTCEEVYGYSVKEFSQNPNLWFDVVVDHDKQAIRKNDGLMFAGQSFSHEYRIHHKDGSIRWLESRLSPTLDQNGKLIRLDGITSDITKRKEAEKTVRTNEYKFRSLIENSSDCITLINEKEETVFASHSIFKLTGYTPEETAGRSSLTYVHPDDINIVQEHFEKVYHNPGIPLVLNYRRRKKDGTYIWCEGTATNLLDVKAVKGIVINFRDITERKNAEKALKDSEYRFRTLLEHSSDFITVINEKQETTFASDTLYRITGYKPDDVVGKAGLMFIHPDDQPEVQKAMEQLIGKPGKLVCLAYRIIRKDGTTVWVERIATNLLHEPAIAGIVSNYRDISAHKEYEAALIESNEGLKKTNMELDKFVYSVSHDLRAPLASMAGMVDLLKIDTTDPESLEKIRYIEGSIGKLDNFIHDILDYSKNARLDVQKEKINLKKLLADITDNLRFLGMDQEYHKVEIKINLANDIPFYSDKHRIEVILNNLVSNAIRYKNPGISDPYVEITVIPSEKDLILRVADNGLGIAKESHQKIFEMFYRLSKNSVGSGLGLYIVKEAVEKLQGSVTVDSEPGKGSVFTVCLPNLVYD